MDPSFIQNIFEIQTEEEFEALALELFKFQAGNNNVYSAYLELLGINPSGIDSLEKIPFLPVELFREHKVVTGNKSPQAVFESSGTSGSGASKHYVADLALYQKSLEQCFRLFFGSPENYCILALLPSYLERGNSSLAYMADRLIRQSKHDLRFWRVSHRPCGEVSNSSS